MQQTLIGPPILSRTRRRLEWACCNAVDFMWLVEGRTIDHSTFCDFRTRFKRELKDLFRQIGWVAMHMGLLRLNQVTLNGTRVKANSPPQADHATASAKTLEQRLQVLDEQIENMLAEADQADQQDDQQDKDLFGDSVSGHTLPAERRTSIDISCRRVNRQPLKRWATHRLMGVGTIGYFRTDHVFVAKAVSLPACSRVINVVSD